MTNLVAFAYSNDFYSGHMTLRKSSSSFIQGNAHIHENFCLISKGSNIPQNITHGASELPEAPMNNLAPEKKT